MPELIKLRLFRPPGDQNDSDGHGDCFQVEQLEEGNYFNWKFRLGLLFGICGVSDIIFDKADPPAAVEVLKKANAFTPEGLYWRKRCFVWRCIYFTLSPDDQILDSIKDNSEFDAKNLWGAIRERERSKRNAWDLRSKLAGIRLEDFENAVSYMIRIDCIIRELEFVNSKPDEVEWKMAPDEQTFWYLHGLPKSWDEWVFQIKIINKDLVYQPKELFRRLRDWDSYLKVQEKRSMDNRRYRK